MALDDAAMKPLRILFCCTGVGICNRGIESFFREAFDGLKKTAPGLNAYLLKGGGDSKRDEIRVWCLPRTCRIARWLGLAIHRNAYTAEQLSSFPFVALHIRRLRPHVIFYSDANLGFQLFRWRDWLGVPYRLLYSNGGPCRPPFNRTDCVHQVAPYYMEEALRAGEPAERHFLVPYGISVPEEPPDHDPKVRRALRQELGLPLDRPVVLSVGWIRRVHKRMHYVVEELARLPRPRPFLQLLGAMDGGSREIVELAQHLLGRDGCSVRSVPYEQVGDFYRAADVFVLASLQEGFGRVYLEALMHGLPVIAHRHPVMEYVLGTEGTLGDLNQVGELAGLVDLELRRVRDEQTATRRWRSIRDRFSWDVLAPQYLQMFRMAAALPFQRALRS
jgi:glycosyltransferase involved in cell wall biosynthesis